MSYTPQRNNIESNFTLGGNHRVSTRQTLFDGKVLDFEDTNKWSTRATGSAVFNSNKVDFQANTGEYVVRQSKFFCPYFSGKPQQIELTMINFHAQTGAIKRAGYFSSSSVAPYSTDYDGIWIESSGGSYKLVCSNAGTITHSIDWTQWDSYQKIRNYDWSKLTVCEIDFLWLGGAGVRLFIVIDGTFTLVHTIRNHAGYADGLIIKNPQQPVRYELRSTVEGALFTAVCCQVTSEGGEDEQGQGLSVQAISKNTNVVGTNYLIAGVRKSSNFRNTYTYVDTLSLGITSSTPDSGLVMLCLNPTYSSPPTWTSNSRIEQTTSDVTVTNFGRILKSFEVVSNSQLTLAPAAALKTLGVNLDNSMTEVVMVYQPTTTNQVVTGSMMLLEY